MACYNVENYVQEAIESIIHQTFDFKDVEIILVDDGSSDSTANICKKYVDMYPENIKYFYKDNGGQASARNFGINYASGKYINFLDADDKLMENTLENVFEFFENNYDKIDLVAVPMYYFERKTGDHLLNYKFEKNMVVDLDKQWDFPQLATNSAFFKRNVFDKYQFDTFLISSEDAVMVNKILFDKMAYGVVSRGGLLYRKRFDESSTIDTSRQDKKFYLDRLNGFFMELIDYSIEKVNHVPKFIQYVIIYDIKWMFITDDRFDILTKDELSEFNQLTSDILNYIDDDIINYHLENDFYNVKKIIFSLKYGGHDIKYDDNDVVMHVCDIVIDKLSKNRFCLDIVEIKNDILYISGFLKSFFTSDEISIEILKTSKSKKELFSPKLFNYFNRKENKYLKSFINFDFTVPLDFDEECDVCILAKYKNSKSFKLPINFFNHARLSETSNYSIWGNHAILFKDNKFFIRRYSYIKMIGWESKILFGLSKSRPPFWTSALFFRFIYLILYPLYRSKKIWMMMDRRDSADDNAVHLYKYCCELNDGVDKYFTVSKESSDFEQLNSLKNVLPFYSVKQRLLYLFSDKIISSHPDEFILNPFLGKNVQLYSGLINSEKIFLQHGVTKDNVALWLRKYDKHLAMLVTVSEREAQSFLDYEYNYDPDVIKVLGFPRFDNLKNNSDKKQILIMPTWRRSIDDLEDEQVVRSLYFKKLNSLFANERLIKISKTHGYNIIIKPHPKIMHMISLFDIDEYIDVDMDSKYQDLFNNSSLLITDYSSVTFDFAYIKKPVIYYQYADDYHFEETFFDYEKMGFGEVISEEDMLIDKIEEYLLNNCKMKDKYKNRVDEFYKFKDRNNCKRVYEAILNL